MKVIPKKDLIIMINTLKTSYIFQSTIDSLFELYGDNWFMEYGGDWELCDKNSERDKKFHTGEDK